MTRASSFERPKPTDGSLSGELVDVMKIQKLDFNTHGGGQSALLGVVSHFEFSMAAIAHRFGFAGAQQHRLSTVE
ncbi:hypothetical protein BCEP27_40011 [Burkholderia cepacia]